MRLIEVLAAVSAAAVLYPYSAEAFRISVEDSCLKGDAYMYHFTETALLPDFSVKVSQSSLVPDLTIKLVTSPTLADLVLVDSSPNEHVAPDMRVCKSASSLSGVVIKVSETQLVPDITVQLSESGLMHDYTLFVDSEYFSVQEAAALFAVIWEKNRRAGNESHMSSTP